MKVIRYTSYTRMFILSRELHKLPHTYKRLLSGYYRKKNGLRGHRFTYYNIYKNGIIIDICGTYNIRI